MNTASLTDNVDITSSQTRVYDFVTLLKPRVMMLVVFTGFVGLYLAPGTIHPFLATVAVCCIACGSGAAGALNMWYERQTDAKMHRTRHRPIPSGKIDPDTALAFGICVGTFSVMIMGLAVHPEAAAWLLFAILYYVFAYTIWLKPRTHHNTIAGGVAGALPPVIGWASISTIATPEPWILFAIIFIWQAPHFWAFALYKEEDYRRAGLPMLPITHGVKNTKLQMLLYTILLLPITLLPCIIGMSGLIYGACATLLGISFLSKIWQLHRSDSLTLAPPVFRFSILYLFFLYVALIADKIQTIPIATLLSAF